MSEAYLVDHAAPTLAGLKTGSLFPCAYEHYDELCAEIRAMNRTLAKKGLRLIPLRRTKDRVLLYLYRPARLRDDLAGKDAAELLREAGYTDLRQERCLIELMKRLQRFEDFPHEIGLFLSYPPEDVRGFIEHRGHGSKCDGCWKVYGDAERAEKLFRTYKKCTDCYRRSLSMGVSLERLAVAG